MMNSDPIERLMLFLKLVKQHHLLIHYPDQVPDDSHLSTKVESGPYVSPTQPNSQLLPEHIREMVNSCGLERGQAEGILGKDGPVFVPLEPITYVKKGLGLLRIGIGKIARSEILRAFWETLSFLRENGRCTSEHFPDFHKDLRYVLCAKPELRDEAIRISRQLDSLPQEFLGLHIPEESVRIGFSQNGRIYDKKYLPRINIIGLEQCNRACAHCAALATPNRPRLRYSDFLRWKGLMRFSSDLTITYGEPFYWSDRFDGRQVTVGDLSADLTSLNASTKVDIVTSGINFDSPRERKAAQTLAALSQEARRRIRLTLTISDYPRFSLEGLGHIEAARKVQSDTIRFAAESGMRLTMISFPDDDKVKEEMIIPVASSLFTGFPKERFAISRNFKCERRTASLVGRAGLREGEYEPEETSHTTRRCLSRQGLTIEREFKPFEQPKEFEPDADGYIVQNADLALMSNGELVPGCCKFESSYAAIADLRQDSPAEIQDKTSAFVQRLDRLRREEKLDCFECISSAGKVRHPKLLRKAYGDAVAARCLRGSPK
jgi:hypothetical protein